MLNEDPPRPRWGTFSVAAHRDPGALAIDVLLYDRLVLPSPVLSLDAATWGDLDRERIAAWQDWEPRLLFARTKQLGELAHMVLWDGEIRAEWSKRWETLKAAGHDIDGLALGMTASVLAMSAWYDRVPPPVMIAAYRSEAEARADYDLSPAAGTRATLDRHVGALFCRMLEMPRVEHADAALAKAIELSNDPAFQKARRSLYQWEDDRLAKGWPAEAALKELQDRVIEHDILVQKAFNTTVRRRVFRVAKFLAGVAVEIVGEKLHLPGAGAVAGVAIEAVQARFPTIEPRAIDAHNNPGAALSIAVGAMYPAPIPNG